MAKKIDLKEMLSSIDKRDKGFYSRLTDEQKKDWSAWMTMKYASSCNGRFSEHYALMVNDIVNSDFNLLVKHPELQWKLLALCGVGTNQFHPFIRPSKRQKKNRKQEFFSKAYPSANSEELDLLESMYTDSELIVLMESMGMDDSEIKEILK